MSEGKVSHSLIAEEAQTTQAQSAANPDNAGHDGAAAGGALDASVSASDRPASIAPPVIQDETLALAQAGDHAAFAQLYSLHKRRVYSLCLRMLSNVAEAEDLTQEAFLQLHRKIATFRGDSAFSTWLHRLTINVVLMHLRRKGLNLISLDEALDPSPDHGPARSFGAPDLRPHRVHRSNDFAESRRRFAGRISTHFRAARHGRLRT